MRRSYLLLIFALVLAFMVGCASTSTDDTITTKTASRLAISPSLATVEVGSTQVYTATATYDDNTTAVISPTWSVTSESGTIGSISSIGLNAIFTGSATGSGFVVATYSSLTASGEIHVTTATETLDLVTIEVFPRLAQARVGQSLTFTAEATNSSAEAITLFPAWTITGEAIGSLTSSGLIATLEVTAEGLAIIQCTSSEVYGYSYVTAEGYYIAISVEVDTYVDSLNSSEAHGSDTSLKSGYVSTSGRYYETYLRFDLSSLPSGISIEAATLEVYPSTVGTSLIQLKKLTSSFSNSTNWSNKPTNGTLIESTTFTTNQYNQLSNSSLTNLVKSWYNNSSNNYGLVFLQEGSSDGTLVILSLENAGNYARLLITYDQ